MLFTVISNPFFSKPTDIDEAKVVFIKWLKDLKEKNKVISAYQRIGKGSVIIFDVESNEELNKLMGEWLAIVPVPITYDIVPMVNPGIV
jgi:hypothetical protein